MSQKFIQPIHWSHEEGKEGALQNYTRFTAVYIQDHLTDRPLDEDSEGHMKKRLRKTAAVGEGKRGLPDGRRLDQVLT